MGDGGQLVLGYKIDYGPSITGQIHDQVSSKASNHFLNVNHPSVEADLYAHLLKEGLSIYAGKVNVKESFLVSREGTVNKNLIVLDFQIDSFARLLLRNNTSDRQLITGGYIASSGFESEVEYQKGAHSKYISYVIHKDWLLEELCPNDAPIKHLLNSKEIFFLFRRINIQIASELSDLHDYIFSEGKLNNQYIFGSTLKVLSSYFDHFTLNEENVSEIGHYDLKGMVEAKAFLDTHIEEKIEMKRLVQIAAMSESKFRKLFLRMYGGSPIDYIKKMKMWYAKGLIEQGELISNVVLKVGYTNHSYFTRSFKASFGVTPQTYQKEVLKRNQS